MPNKIDKQIHMLSTMNKTIVKKPKNVSKM
jgi:hypothetical protein